MKASVLTKNILEAEDYKIRHGFHGILSIF